MLKRFDGFLYASYYKCVHLITKWASVFVGTAEYSKMCLRKSDLWKRSPRPQGFSLKISALGTRNGVRRAWRDGYSLLRVKSGYHRNFEAIGMQDYRAITNLPIS